MAFIPGATGTASSFPDGFVVVNGTVTAPTFKFQDAQTGFYRPALNQWALSSNGVQTWLVSATGVHTFGATAANVVHTINGNIDVIGQAGETVRLRKTGGASIAIWADNVGTSNKLLIDNSSGTLRVLDNATTTTLASLTQSGAAVIGASGFLGAHTFNAQNSAFQSSSNTYVEVIRTGSNSTLIGSEAGFGVIYARTTAGGVSNMRFYTGNTLLAGSYDTVGAWTLGPVGNTSLFQTITGGTLQVPAHVRQKRIAVSNGSGLVSPTANGSYIFNFTNDTGKSGVYHVLLNNAASAIVATNTISNIGTHTVTFGFPGGNLGVSSGLPAGNNFVSWSSCEV